MVTESIRKLQSSELVATSGVNNSNLESTEYGEIMSEVRNFPLTVCRAFL